MHNLMAATDLSSRSGKALHQAMLIALQCGARLVILHVVDERQPTDLTDRRISEVKTFLNASAADIAVPVHIPLNASYNIEIAGYSRAQPEAFKSACLKYSYPSSNNK